MIKLLTGNTNLVAFRARSGHTIYFDPRIWQENSETPRSYLHALREIQHAQERGYATDLEAKTFETSLMETLMEEHPRLLLETRSGDRIHCNPLDSMSREKAIELTLQAINAEKIPEDEYLRFWGIVRRYEEACNMIISKLSAMQIS